jgi:membrane protein
MASLIRRLSHPIPWPHLRDLLRFALRRLNEEHLPQVAASLTFTTVLALVPLLTIALAIFTAFPLFDTLRASLEAYFVENLMPRGIANTILNNLNQFAAKSMELSALGGAVLVITAVAMMSTIDQVFNQIWRVKARRPFVQRILVYWAILTLGPLLIGLSIKMTSYVFSATDSVAHYVPFAGGVFYTVLSVMLTTFAFALLYIHVPNRIVDWRDALWGGLVAGIAFEAAKRLFAWYVTSRSTYTMIYGAVAAVPIFLLWIYMFWVITLVGALLTAALPVVRHERWWHVESPGSIFVDAMAVLRVLVDAHNIGRSSAVDAETIRARTRLGFDESEALLDRMLEAGWVARIKADVPKRKRWPRPSGYARERWVLIANPHLLKLADVYRLFVFTARVYTPLAQKAEAIVEQGLDESIGDFFSQQPEVRKKPVPSASAGTLASSQ